MVDSDRDQPAHLAAERGLHHGLGKGGRQQANFTAEEEEQAADLGQHQRLLSVHQASVNNLIAMAGEVSAGLLGGAPPLPRSSPSAPDPQSRSVAAGWASPPPGCTPGG